MGWKGLLLRYSANDRVTYIRGDPRQAKNIVLQPGLLITAPNAMNDEVCLTPVDFN